MKGKRFFIKCLFVVLLLCIAAPVAFAAGEGKKSFTLVIDPGHGGTDPGALGRKAKEKDVNLSVSKALAEMIEDEFPEVKIIFTRKTDVQVPLIRRAEIANNAKADLFISIHSNASKTRTANGCETFTLGAGSSAEAKAAAMYENNVILLEDNFEQTYKGFDPKSSESYIIFELIRNHDTEKSIALADAVQSGMVKRSGLRNRGVSSAGFLVLHKTVMPSILVELGFISNRKEESVIASKNGQKNLAKGIFEGFKEYYRLYGTTTAKEKSSKKKSKAATAAVKPATEPVAATTKKEAAQKGQPVFKVQILASSTKLTAKDSRLKGVKADYYREGGMYKYTCGNSTDYNEIAALRKKLAATFKEAFVIAFIDGKKADTKKAIEIYKNQAK